VKVDSNKYINYTDQKKIKIDATSTYFINEMSDMYIWNYFISFTLFLMCKFLYIIFKQIHFKNKIMKKMVNYFKAKSMKHILILALIENNLICISFTCALQIKIIQHFCFVDKIN